MVVLPVVLVVFAIVVGEGIAEARGCGVVELARGLVEVEA
jgi:hypothetical protein